MSNAAAIAAATAGLQRWLQQEVAIKFGANCTTMRPDMISKTDPVVNLYLYQVTFNAGHRNIDQPMLRSDGTQLNRPTTAVDLHYLVTCTAKDDEIVAQLLLAQVVRVFHARPLLSRKMISDAVAASANGEVKKSELAKQREPIRLTPLTLGLEEMSKIWGLYPDTPCMLSAAYLATTIILEGDEMPEPALPVQGPAVAAGAWMPPKLFSIATVVDGANIELRFQGEKFANDCVIFVDDEGEIANGLTITSALITVAAPATSFPGLKTGRIRRTISVNGTDVIFDSDSQPYVIRPLVKTVSLNAGTFKITLHRKVKKAQEAALLLYPIAGGPPTVVAFPAIGADTATLEVASAGVAAGEYIVRVRVDKADSLTGVTGDPPVPTPMVTVP